MKLKRKLVCLFMSLVLMFSTAISISADNGITMTSQHYKVEDGRDEFGNIITWDIYITNYSTGMKRVTVEKNDGDGVIVTRNVVNGVYNFTMSHPEGTISKQVTKPATPHASDLIMESWNNTYGYRSFSNYAKQFRVIYRVNSPVKSFWYNQLSYENKKYIDRYIEGIDRINTKLNDALSITGSDKHQICMAAIKAFFKESIPSYCSESAVIAIVGCLTENLNGQQTYDIGQKYNYARDSYETIQWLYTIIKDM